MKNLCLVLCLVLASYDVLGFGYGGRDGQNGTDGIHGAAGEDVVISADGQSEVLNLNGADGTNGGDATEGGDASSCSHSTGRSNEYGASGGNGGRGGHGGNGGDGGDVTIFYSDIEDLKKIKIFSVGGQGGVPGSGAAGGYGCSCSTSSWSHEVCTTTQSCTTRNVCSTSSSCSTRRVCTADGGSRTANGRTAPTRTCRDVRSCSPTRSCRDVRECTPVTTCRDQSYYCSSGSNGSNGGSGNWGADGQAGSMYLVRDLEQIPAQTPKKTVTFLEGVDSKHLLSKNIWLDQTGFKKLVHQDSLVVDKYQEYSHLAQKFFELVWDVQRDMTPFNDREISLNFDGKEMSAKMPEDLFIDYETIEDDAVKKIKINNLFKKDEIENLKIEKTQSFGKNLKLIVKDNASISKIVKTKVKLQFVHRALFWRWYVVYDKEVPTKALEFEDDKIIVNVGALGINRKYIKSGKRVRYTLRIEREFGGNKTEVKLFQPKIVLTNN